MSASLNPRSLVNRARLLTGLIALGAASYLGLRFDFVTLPPDGCSPVSRYSPGSRLLVDRWADGFREGDCVFVTEASGVVHLATLEAAGAPGSWSVQGDSADCPGLFPAAENPVTEGSVLGRVVLSFGR